MIDLHMIDLNMIVVYTLLLYIALGRGIEIERHASKSCLHTPESQPMRPPRAHPRSPSSSGLGRIVLIVGGVLLSSCFLCCGVGMVVGWFGSERDKKQLAAAHRQWEGGQKAEAVAAYKVILDRGSSRFPPDTDRTVIYHRLIEYELGKGDTEAAKNWIGKALDNKVELTPANKTVADLIVVVRAEREQRAEQDRTNREAEAKRKQEEREAEAKRREDERAAGARRKQEEKDQRPRVSAELLKVRHGPFRTADGLNTTMVYADWKNTGNRPVRAVRATIEVFDAQGRQVYSAKDYTIYAVANDDPGIAPGETYVGSDGRGHILPPLLEKPAARFTIQITRADEKGY